MSQIPHFCRKFSGTNPRFPERLELFPGLQVGLLGWDLWGCWCGGLMVCQGLLGEIYWLEYYWIVIHNSDYGLDSALVKLWFDGILLGRFLMVTVGCVRWLVIVNLTLTLAMLQLGQVLIVTFISHKTCDSFQVASLENFLVWAPCRTMIKAEKGPHTPKWKNISLF